MDLSQTATQSTSLKTIYDSLNETALLLVTTKDKLEFAVHGATPKEESKPMSTEGIATIEMIGSKMYAIARLSSTIAKLTNSIVGI